MEIPKKHKAAFFDYSETERIRYFQDGWGGLKVDGIYGTETAGAADQYIRGELPDAPDTPRIEQAFWAAKLDEGKREAPLGSNGGPYVDSLRVRADLERLAGGQWCGVFQTVHLNDAGIPVSSRGAPGIVRGMIALPRGREVDIEDIGVGFFGMALRERGIFRGKRTHHVQCFRYFATDKGPRIEHVGGNESHRVKSATWKPAKFYKGVIQVATYV